MAARAFISDDLDPEFQLLRKFDEAWRADLALIRELTREEQQAEEDRAFAASLAGVTLDELPEDRRKMAMLLDDFDDDDDDDNNNNDTNHEDEQTSTPLTSTNNPSTTRTTTNTQRQPKPKKCAVCMEYVRRNDPHAPCGHAYCIECLRELFKASMQDETLMPPRCCREEIPTDLARLTLKETGEFNAKRLEYSTTDRLYCSRPTCSAFIPPTNIVNSVGTCPKVACGATTCSICKAASHGNLDCPKDEATSAVLVAADEAGWSRCYRCRSLVELTIGCYHITCRCRAEFCYLCSVPWKNCTCPQWDEERLTQEARARTARIRIHEVPRAGDRVDLAQRIERIANQLRANHECRHTNGWAYTRGGGRCDECHHFLPQYLYRCSQCQFMACNRCRRNRL